MNTNVATALLAPTTFAVIVNEPDEPLIVNGATRFSKLGLYVRLNVALVTVIDAAPGLVSEIGSPVPERLDTTTLLPGPRAKSGRFSTRAVVGNGATVKTST